MTSQIEFRAPMLGARQLLGETTKADWPLQSIEIVDGIPFLIVRGHTLAGHAETAESYLKYCEEHCDWSGARYQYNAHDEKEKAAALARLLT